MQSQGAWVLPVIAGLRGVWPDLRSDAACEAAVSTSLGSGSSADEQSCRWTQRGRWDSEIDGWRDSAKVTDGGFLRVYRYEAERNDSPPEARE